MFWDTLDLFIGMKTQSTQRSYRAILRDYSRFLGADADRRQGEIRLLRASAFDAARWIKELQNRKGQRPRVGDSNTLAAAGTVRYKLQAMTKIYKVLIDHKQADYNPFADASFDRIRAIRKQKRPTEMIPFEKVMELVNAPRSLRDKALLAVLFGGALRRAEAANLLIGDVRTSNAGQVYLYLRFTKAGVDAEQSLPVWCSKLLFKLIKQRKLEGARDHDPLFAEHWGAPMTPMAVYKVFKTWCAAIGLSPNFSPHSARATAITKLLSDGIGYRKVQQFSRHKDLKTVEIYDKRRLNVDDSPARLLTFVKKAMM